MEAECLNGRPAGNPLRVIAGSGRSGTTWVLDTLTEANCMRPVFEPLHPLTCGLTAQKYANRYLVSGDEHPELRKFVISAAAGDINNSWVNYRVIPQMLDIRWRRFRSARATKKWLRDCVAAINRVRSFRPQLRHEETIVKVIRGNLLLDWLASEFNTRVLFLIRHPAAVIESQLRFERAWDPARILSIYLDDDALMDGPLATQQAFLRGNMSRAAAYTSVWAIQNLVPLTQSSLNHDSVVFYEELLESPEIQWQRTIDALELSRIPSGVMLDRPSQQATRDIGGSSYQRSYAKWRQVLSSDDLHEIQKTLDRFEIDWYTVEEDRPVKRPDRIPGWEPASVST